MDRRGSRGRGLSGKNAPAGGRKPRSDTAQPQEPKPHWGIRGTLATTSARHADTRQAAGTSVVRPAAPTSVDPSGRGYLPQYEGDTTAKEKSHAVAGEGATARGAAGEGVSTRGAIRGKRVINDIIRTKPISCNTKKGTIGKQIVVQSNYFRASKRHDWTIHQYSVAFNPDIELVRVRKGILSEHRQIIGGYIFDGQALFTTTKLVNDPTEIVGKSRNGEPYKITIKFVGIVKPTDGQFLQVLNLILRRAMEGLKLQLVGRNFFDPNAKVGLQRHHLELWPGYLTSIRQHEEDILLCAEISHKVMRTDTIHDILRRCIQESRNYRDLFMKEIIGMVVLTDYNNKTYRVDDVDFKQNPQTKFDTKDGPISFIDYYKKRYNIQIRDPDQPLLASKSTEKRLRAGESEVIMLIPELCRATGLNERMKSNFELMKDLSKYTRLPPNDRIRRLKTFNGRLYSTKESIDVMNSWNLTLDKNLVEFPARVLKPENIVFGKNVRASGGMYANWSNEFRNRIALFKSVHLNSWVVLMPPKSQKECKDFIQAVRDVAQKINLNIAEPEYIQLLDDRNHTYISVIEKCCTRDPQLICTIVPNNNAERYSCIKKKTCIDRGIPSQVLVLKKITPSRGKNISSLLSVATKVAIQLTCKLSGAPWMIEMPLEGVMFVGFDVCHSSRDRSKSYGALVATMDIRVSTKYFSAVSEHNKGQELSSEISLIMVKAIQEWRNTHGNLPKQIIFYRDGVGDGQLHQVFQVEVQQLKQKLDTIYKDAGIEKGCQLAFIVVSKRINTRFFIPEGNPLPGTVVDDVVTLPERYDFFLVSQSVRDGTVSPTSYNVIFDNTGIKVDHMQIIAYKMTHLYYNVFTTMRVPAMCQYAHKLAFLVAQSLFQCPSNKLEKQLYFL